MSFNKTWHFSSDQKRPSFTLLDANYSPYILPERFTRLRDLRLRFTCLHHHKVVNDLRHLISLEKVVLFNDCISKSHASMERILEFIASFQKCVKEFVYIGTLGHLEKDLGDENKNDRSEKEIFAIFIECLICEMHLKFPMKLSNALLKVFDKFVCNTPVTEFLGFGFIGGHLYVNFLNHGLHKLQKNPYKLIVPTTKEVQQFFFDFNVVSFLQST